MHFFERMMRILWTARVTYVEVLRKAGVERYLMQRVKRRQLKFLRHLVRAAEL